MLCLQILGRVYAVLSDKEQKAVYDEQGTVDEDSAGLNQDRDWDAYWRLLFKKVKSFSGFDKFPSFSPQETIREVKATFFVIRYR